MIERIINIILEKKNLLYGGCIFIVIGLILISHTYLIPLKPINFWFVVFISFFSALYRPQWMFLLFIAVLPLENIILSPEDFIIAVRPYQLIGFFTIIGFGVNYSAGRLQRSFVRLQWFDYGIVLLVVSSFIALINAPDINIVIKQILVLTSFSALYFLTRQYIQKESDVKLVIPFFIASSIIIMFYGIIQNWRFTHGLDSFEVMPGRVNATFTEPNWYGIYLNIVLAVILSFYYSVHKKNDNLNLQTIKKICTIVETKNIVFMLFLTTVFISTILTASRSAWITTIVILILFLFLSWNRGEINLKNIFAYNLYYPLISILISFSTSILIIYIFSLTNFELSKRLESTSGLQEITIACNVSDIMEYKNHNQERYFKDILPDKIKNTDELVQFKCRHINLEEIIQEKEAGNYITKIMRDDPNVKIRSRIYETVLTKIKENWLIGIGWGSIAKDLGDDQRGTALNASNIFFETWLGSGIIGVAILIGIFIFIIYTALRRIFQSDHTKITTIQTVDGKEYYVASFLIIVVLIIPNLFNSGIFLGFVWVSLAVILYFVSQKKH